MFVSRVNPITGAVEWTLREAPAADMPSDDAASQAGGSDADNDDDDATDEAVHASMHLVRGLPVGLCHTTSNRA